MTDSEKEFIQEGMNCLKEGDLERAEEIFKDFLQEHPASDLADNACYQVAQIQKKNGNKEKALSWLDYILKNYPESDAAYFAKDEREELQRDMEAVVPGTPEEAIARGKLAFSQGNLAEAEKLFIDFLRTHWNSNLADNAHYNLAVIYRKLGRKQEAQKHIDILMRDFPASDSAIMARYLVDEPEKP